MSTHTHAYTQYDIRVRYSYPINGITVMNLQAGNTLTPQRCSDCKEMLRSDDQIIQEKQIQFIIFREILYFNLIISYCNNSYKLFLVLETDEINY